MKSTRIIIISLASLLILSSLSFAQEVNNKSKNDTLNNKYPVNYLGVSFSYFSSIGISWHHVFEVLTIKLTYGMIHNGAETWQFYGGEFQLGLTNDRINRTYLLFGAGYSGNDNNGRNFFGTAIGFEHYVIKNYLSFNFDLGIRFDIININNYYQTTTNYRSKFGWGSGLSYIF